MKFNTIGVALLLIAFAVSGCTASDRGETAANGQIEKSQTLIIDLVSWAAMDSSNNDTRLVQKIERFREQHPNVQITYHWNDFYSVKSNWLKTAQLYSSRAKAGDLPDIVELVPNQMKFWHQYGIIEPLAMNESVMDDYVIKSSERYVLGVKSKVNPLIVYYNKDVFQSLGLDPPSGEWDMRTLCDTVAKLQAAGRNVFLPLSPFTLEWVTSLQGGRIAASDGGTFAGYIDSEEAVQAAEWIASIGTKIDAYKERPIGNGIGYIPIPFDLLEGGIALAVDFAFGFNHGGTNSYESIAQRNDNIGVAALPRGTTGINPAQISGLSVTSQSQNKPLAMELLRYLTTDIGSIHSDITMNTLEINQGRLVEPLNKERFATVMHETERAVPAALYMYNDLGNYHKYMWSRPKAFYEIRNGLPAQEALAEFADILANDFRNFYKEPAAFDACIESSAAYSDSCL